MVQVTVEVSEERYVLQTGIDARLPVETVRSIFPLATGLYYFNNMQRHVVDLQEEHFRPPPDGWLDRVYFCIPGKLSHGEGGYPFYNLFIQVRDGKENWGVAPNPHGSAMRLLSSNKILCFWTLVFVIEVQRPCRNIEFCKRLIF